MTVKILIDIIWYLGKWFDSVINGNYINDCFVVNRIPVNWKVGPSSLLKVEKQLHFLMNERLTIGIYISILWKSRMEI